jgi:hypothetical protein
LPHDIEKHVMDELDAGPFAPLLDMQEAASHEFVDDACGYAFFGQQPVGALPSNAVAGTGIGHQLILDEFPHRPRLIFQRPLVKGAQNVALAQPRP